MATAPRFARSEGPGEMSEAFGIVVLADGDIMVAGRQRDLFSSEGIYLESHAPGPGSDQGALTLDLDASPSGRWIVTHEFTLYPEPSVQLRVYDHEMRSARPPLSVADATSDTERLPEWAGESSTSLPRRSQKPVHPFLTGRGEVPTPLEWFVARRGPGTDEGLSSTPPVSRLPWRRCLLPPTESRARSLRCGGRSGLRSVSSS